MNKRILIATGIYPPDVGGPATYSRTLFEELPLRGLSVEVVTYGELLVSDSALVHRVSRRVLKGIRHTIYFFKVFWYGRRADVIFAQDTVSAGLPALVAATLLRKKFLLKIVGDYA